MFNLGDSRFQSSVVQVCVQWSQTLVFCSERAQTGPDSLCDLALLFLPSFPESWDYSMCAHSCCCWVWVLLLFICLLDFCLLC